MAQAQPTNNTENGVLKAAVHVRATSGRLLNATREHRKAIAQLEAELRDVGLDILPDGIGVREVSTTAREGEGEGS